MISIYSDSFFFYQLVSIAIKMINIAKFLYPPISLPPIYLFEKGTTNGVITDLDGSRELTEYNTVDNMDNVAFRSSKASIARKNAKYTFPRYSYTLITLKQ